MRIATAKYCTMWQNCQLTGIADAATQQLQQVEGTKRVPMAVLRKLEPAKPTALVTQ
jgi:hypothetical protein